MSKPLVALPALIADVGGTNARFSLVDETGEMSPPISCAVASHRDVADAIADFVLPALPVKPRSFVPALATAIKGESIKLTHAHWTFTPRDLIARFGFDDVILLNDFEALALALPSLTPDALKPIGTPRPPANGPKLVVGAGTGFGVGALMPAGDAWLPISTEGGHLTYGPATERDFAIWPHLPRTVGRTEVEAVLAGKGIVNLYTAIATTDGVPVEALGVGEIVDRARAGTDPVAAEAIRLFTAHTGRQTGDMALLYLPLGGVYIGGGVVARLGDLFDDWTFRSAFDDKEPFRKLMESIGTSIIVHPCPALVGIAALVTEPQRYLVDLTGRHWTRSD